MSDRIEPPRRPFINHVYIFTFRGNLLDDLQHHITQILSSTNDTQPDIKVNDAVHGICCVELLNFRETAVCML